ncbi:DNA-3-methyladenine glycosylase family protein [Hufsiella ginkgonis]|uniref:DNA-3-methyladenine glycosylase II n=1 Tax=Hufsiella ginkgonis TaxID=2695274 RepID=A0A7K1XWW8_9SPHI|nr:DNA-3-methyladenine glycosylase [Hufsiella ginkgonis]MXV15288.1 DNA repair protein [Hufsiella ginkgonis]
MCAKILLPVPLNFSFAECLWYLDRNYDDCLHHIHDNQLTKLLDLAGTPVLLQLSGTKHALEVKLPTGNDHLLPDAARYVRDWLDIDRDIEPFYQLLSQDAQFAFMAHDFNGLRLIGIPDLFEALCWCVIGQQINLTFAYTLKRRLVEKFGSSVLFESRTCYAFPTPGQLQHASHDQLRAMQFSGRKAEYILHLASLFSYGEINKAMLEEISPEEAFSKLISIRGIGAWTAHYTLMKCLRNATNIPYGDAGLNKALHLLKNTSRKPTNKEIDAVFEHYQGWQSYLVIYLWRSLAQEAGRSTLQKNRLE